MDTSNLKNTVIDEKHSKKLRASYYFMGALLGKEKYVEMYIPGGCNIGARPIDMHIDGFKALGAEVITEGNKYILKAEKLKLLADNANEYAAVSADIITSAPSYSDENDLFTTDVPFYQIVFKGSVPIICDSLNLADSADNQLLKAAEGGMGLQYTVINNYDKSLITAEQDVFAFCNYDSIAERLSVTVKSYGDYFGAIKNAKIISHEIINEDIRNTVFSNGTMVFVNYGTAEYETDIGTVKPNSFIYKKGSVE